MSSSLAPRSSSPSGSTPPPPAPGASPPGTPASPVPAQSPLVGSAPLRGPARAVLALAAVSVLLRIIQEILLVLISHGMALEVLYQAQFLVSIPVWFLLGAAVIWLVQASRTRSGAGLRPLLALVLFTLGNLLDPVWQVLSAALTLAPPTGPGVDLVNTVLPAGTLGADLLVRIAVGLVALVILLRPAAAERPVRMRVGPLPLALALLVLALGAAIWAALSTVIYSLADGGALDIVIQFGVPMVASLLDTLIVLTAGLLIVTATGAVRRAGWTGLALFWLSKIVIVLVIRIMVARMILAAGHGDFALWDVISGVPLVLGLLATAACAAVALVLLVSRRRTEVSSSAS